MDKLESITGTIDRYLFQNHENGYSVFIVQALPAKTKITVTGYIPNICVGQEIQLCGKWVIHSKFGKQFEAQTYIVQLPTSLIGLKKYLSSGLIKGIGATYADKLIAYFGTDIITIIEQTPERLKEVSGMGQKRIEKITEAWKSQKDISNLMIFLQERDITPALAARIYKQYKHQAIAMLQENPYRIADEIWGIGFKTADDIAQKLGFVTHAPQRIAAGILYAINTASQSGHLYVELEELKNKVTTLLTLEQDARTKEEIEELLKNALYTLYNSDKIRHISQEDKHFITLTPFYFCEKGIANRIKTVLENRSSCIPDSTLFYKHLHTANAHEITLNQDQQEAIVSCLRNKITVITGGPGTGKTTVIKKLLTLLELESIHYKLAAPTGRAAKRIIESTGRQALTIHRLLEFDINTMSFTYNETKKLKVDFLIIDEASMIDVFLAHALLKALPYTAHLVLIGDIDQLPSVGPGNVLHDLLASKKISYVRLTQIFRQAQDSLIITNAHRINNGEFPITSKTKAQPDFLFIKEDDPEVLPTILKEILFLKLIHYGISPHEAMVLTPMNRGLAGTATLNGTLQELLNPAQHFNTITYAGTLFKEGDKVMQIRNNYDKQVYNGDIGIIETIDLDEKEVTINFGDSRTIIYEFDELNEITLAYAITIHKSQGSEYKAVIVPLFTQHWMLLQKNLIYTALTRARKLCIFVGQNKALAIALGNTKGSHRVTFLQRFLTEA